MGEIKYIIRLYGEKIIYHMRINYIIPHKIIWMNRLFTITGQNNIIPQIT